MSKVIANGTEIVIRESLKLGKCGNDVVVEGMLKHAGKSAKITGNRSENKYAIDIDNGEWNWTPEMFSVVVEEPKPAKPAKPERSTKPKRKRQE